MGEDGIKKFRTIALLTVALAAIALGFGIGGYELYQAMHNKKDLNPWPFFASGMFILLGAGVVQYGDIRSAVQIATDAIPLIRSIRPGGQRATDPPVPPAAAPPAPTAPPVPVPTQAEIYEAGDPGPNARVGGIL